MNILIVFYFYRITFCVILCLFIFTFFSCKPPVAVHDQLSKETFTKLRSMFPGPILDKNFKTLKKITSSKVYLDFLKQAYRVDKSFQTFDEFVDAVSPSDGRYRSFLNEHIENPTDADIRGIHQLALIYRRSNIMMVHAELAKKSSYLQKALMEKNFAVHKKPIADWWYSSELAKKNETQSMLLFLGFEYFVLETEKEDTDWIQAQFNNYGQAEGMLWVAIRNPILTREILKNCGSIDLFFAWVSQELILQRLSALQEVSEDK